MVCEKAARDLEEIVEEQASELVNSHCFRGQFTDKVSYMSMKNL